MPLLHLFPMAAVYQAFDQKALDREYSPSSLVEDLDTYLREYRERSSASINAATAERLCDLDVRYGSGPAETLDMFRPRSTEPAPLQVYIHGGFWQLLGKEDSSFAAPVFQRSGAAFAAINYTLAPQQSLTGIVTENRRALAFLFENAERWNIDRERVYLSGSSAGAHLVMMMLLTDWQAWGLPAQFIKGVCAVSGVYDLDPVRLSYVNDAVGMSVAEARANSPMHHPLRNECPIVMAYGANETSEFKRQTDDYRRCLADGGTEVTFREVPNRNHFDVILDLGDAATWLGRAALEQMGLRPSLSA